MNQTWTELILEVSEEAEEAAAALLFSVGCRGTASERFAEGVRIKGYLPVSDDVGEAVTSLWDGLDRIREAGLDGGRARVLVNRVDEEDWAEAWKKHFHPLEIGRTWLIKPTWELIPETTGRIVIELDPGMAFGSGTHPTTQLCLRMLEPLLAEWPSHSAASSDTRRSPTGRGPDKSGSLVTPQEAKTGLDIGCGSGILAIAMAKAGIPRVLAIDNDPVAVKVAAENARLNAVEDNVEVQQRDLRCLATSSRRSLAKGGAIRHSRESGKPECLSSPLPAAIVMANLTAQTILDHCLALRACLAPKGALIASGISVERTQEVATALKRAGLEQQTVLTDGGWAGILAR